MPSPPKPRPVGDGEEGDAHLAALRVHGSLHVHGYGGGALVEDRELRAVVEKARHLQALAMRRSIDHISEVFQEGNSTYRYPLLLSPGQDVHPVLHGIPAAFPREDIPQLHSVEHRQ